MIRFDDIIAKILAKTYGERVVEELHVLLSDAEFYDDLEKLKERYGIQPSDFVDEIGTQEFIAQAVHTAASEELYAPTEAARMQNFINAITAFQKDLRSVCEKHGVSEVWLRLLEIYIARGKVTPRESAEGVVKASLDPKTKKLIIEISPESTRKEDLELVWGAIYKAASQFRPSLSKYQPSHFAERDAKISRFRQSHTVAQTANEFSLDEDSVKKIVKRQKLKRAQIKKGTTLPPETLSLM